MKALREVQSELPIGSTWEDLDLEWDEESPYFGILCYPAWTREDAAAAKEKRKAKAVEREAAKAAAGTSGTRKKKKTQPESKALKAQKLTEKGSGSGGVETGCLRFVSMKILVFSIIIGCEDSGRLFLKALW